MSGGSSRPPPAPDPERMIQLQAQYNRVGRTGPFGSSTYESGPNGSTNINTTLSPQMQSLVDRQFRLAGQDSQQYRLPSGVSGIRDNLISRVGANGGQGDRMANFHAAQQNGALPAMIQDRYRRPGDVQQNGATPEQIKPPQQRQPMPPPNQLPPWMGG